MEKKGKGIVTLNKLVLLFFFNHIGGLSLLAALLKTALMSLSVSLNFCNPKKETLTEKLALCTVLTIY